MKNEWYLYILLGAVGWTFAGYINNDRALMVNFGIQIPLFLLGFAKVII